MLMHVAMEVCPPESVSGQRFGEASGLAGLPRARQSWAMSAMQPSISFPSPPRRHTVLPSPKNCPSPSLPNQVPALQTPGITAAVITLVFENVLCGFFVSKMGRRQLATAEVGST